MVIRDNYFTVMHKNLCCYPSSEPSRYLCCDPSSEPSQRDGSDEGSQHMVSIRNKKKYLPVIIKY